ncbi:hypothetical protein [Runella zeae]|uniref:hypothetical protein n=1 Tax=Runella zeae TaxID=94255 RepID=UPI00048EF94C|nr:hypothetical protein [Runella zeae]
MKNHVCFWHSIAICVLLLWCPITIWAQENSIWGGLETPTFQTLTVPDVGTPMLKVYVSKKARQEVMILLKDAEGMPLARRIVRAYEFQKIVRFDLSLLPFGNYRVEVSDKKHITTKSFRKEQAILAKPLTVAYVVAIEK